MAGSPVSATRTASSKRVGIPYVRPKSWPVPAGRIASSALEPTTPLTTSFSVPSPPTTTSRSCVPRGVARELDQVPRPLREEHVAVEAERTGPLAQLRPALAGFSVRARRIDEEDAALMI